MRIEILVGNEEPQIFPINKPKIVIGSHESCDIILSAGGISRKHLIIVVEDDNYFAVDQGSTNGSYINEERLVPGRKIEFTSFFPLRLGDNVLVTLLSDEDASDLGFSDLVTKKEATSPKIIPSDMSDGTRTISLKDLQSGNTSRLQKKRHESVAKRKVKTAVVPSPAKKDKNRMFFVKLFCAGLVGAAAYYNFYILETETTAPIAPLNKVAEVVVPAPALKPKFPLVEKIDLTPKDRFDAISKGLACTSDLEKYLCDMFATDGQGIIQSGTMVHLFLDATDYLQKARESIPPYKQIGDLPDPARVEKYENDLMFMTVLFFLFEKVPQDLDYGMFKDVNLTFVLNISGREYPAVFVPESLSRFMKDLAPKNFELARRHGADALKRYGEYFKTY